MTPSPALPVIAPLLCAALLAALRRWLPRLVIDLLAALTALFNLLLCLRLFEESRAGSIVYWFGNWYPRGHMVLGIGFLIGPAGAILAALASLLTLLGLIYSWGGMESGHNHYQPLMLIFMGAMCGFCFTADLFNLFVFFELMSTAAFALCGLNTGEPAPLQGSFNFAVTNTVGAFLTLTGIALLYGATGALNMAQMGWLLGSRHDSLVLVGCLFVIGGFLIKAAIAPFHFWLADAHSVAPTPVCVLFSGIMVELGLFAILRIMTAIFGSSFAGIPDPVRGAFLVLGGLTAIWGGMMSFAEHHLKRVLAFSTISHSGLMLFAMGLGSRIAIAGWLIYVCAHAFVKSGLFFSAGVLLHRLRTMSEPALFGRARHLKAAAALWFLGGCGLAGLPPFATALGEDMVSHGREGMTLWAAAFFLISGAMTGGAVLRIFMRVFCGWGDAGPSDRSSQVDELPETHEKRRPTPLRLILPAAICIALGIALSFLPTLKSLSLEAAGRFVSQSRFIAAIYSAGQPQSKLAAVSFSFSLGSMLAHGAIALFLAMVLSAAAVFHRRLPRRLRWPSRLEGRMRWARQLQSGQPADYVAWSVAGVAVLGAVFLFVR